MNNNQPNSDIIPILCLDIGGTLTKITFAAKKNYKLECKVHDNLTIHHLIENYNVYSLSHPNSMEVLNGWVKEMGLCGKIKKIYITGGGAFKYQEELSQYGELVKINEFEALKRGLFICQQVIQGGKGIFYIQSINSICASYSMLIFNQESIYPFLLVNIGSGVSILKFENKEEFTRISGTSLGGGMFLGLCHLFTGINDFDKLLQMSKQGSNEATDLLMDEMTLGFDSPTKNKNAAHVAVSLGKLQKSPNNVKQEDLVKSFLYMTTYNISQLAYMHSKLQNIERVIFSGHFIRNHTETLECIAQAFDYFSKVDGHPRYPYFITHDGFMGSLGAFVTAMQEEYKLL